MTVKYNCKYHVFSKHAKMGGYSTNIHPGGNERLFGIRMFIIYKTEEKTVVITYFLELEAVSTFLC